MAADLAVLIEAVRAAGEEGLRRFGSDVRTWTKDDGSPVSEADLAANETLRAALLGARPHYGWRSEEDGAAAGTDPRTFVVDPIDGTRAYLRKETAWTVVAAIVEAGRPVAAAIYRPMGGALYTAVAGEGAARDGRPLAISSCAGVAGARVAMPGPLYRDCGFKGAGVSRTGSVPSLALRLAKVGEGRIDAVITKPGAHHWDLAAADLIVREAGGTLTGLSGAVLDYAAEDTSHGCVVAGPLSLVEALRRIAAGSEPTVERDAQGRG